MTLKKYDYSPSLIFKTSQGNLKSLQWRYWISEIQIIIVFSDLSKKQKDSTLVLFVDKQEVFDRSHFCPSIKI